MKEHSFFIIIIIIIIVLIKTEQIGHHLKEIATVHANSMEHRDNLHGCRYCTAGIVNLEHELIDILYHTFWTLVANQ